MALIKCPNCGNQMSDKALCCPACGYENQAQEKKIQNFYIFFTSNFYFVRVDKKSYYFHQS